MPRPSGTCAPTLATLTAVALTSGCQRLFGGSDSRDANSSADDAATASSAPLTPELAQKHLEAAGWIIREATPGEDDWPSAYLKIQREGDDFYSTIDISIQAFGESSSAEGPKPVLTVGSNALVRVGWAPQGDAHSPAPDLSAIAKEIAATATPDKILEDFFLKSSKVDEMTTKWKLQESRAEGGGRSQNGWGANYRVFEGEGGKLYIHSVMWETDSSLHWVGNTLVRVPPRDDAEDENLLALLAGI